MADVLELLGDEQPDENAAKANEEDEEF